MIDRNVPAVIATYNVDGLPEGDSVMFSFTVAGTPVSAVATAGAAGMSLDIYGRVGNIVEGITAHSSGSVYIGPLVGDTFTAYPLVGTKVVSYSNVSGDPAVADVIPNAALTAYCDGAEVASFATDEAGMATVSLPDASVLSFMMGIYSVPFISVASGPFSGCIAVNLYGVAPAPAPTQITLTIRYIATSSLQNTETPTNVDILDSPIVRQFAIGSTEVFIAPDIDGFSFSGWNMNGTMVSDSANQRMCVLPIVEGIDGSVLTASYAAEIPEEESDNVPIIMGGVAIVIAVLALLLAAIQMRRY